jgi:serine/threonine protein kinase
LGCTLYYAVTGKVPFPRGTTQDKVKAHCERQPLDPRRLNKDLEESFVEVIADMMAKEPAERVGAASDVICRLRPWVPQQENVPAPPIADDSRLGGQDPFGMADTQAAYPEGPGSAGQISQVSQTTDRVGAASSETDSALDMSDVFEQPIALAGPLILFVAIPLGIMGVLAVIWSVLSAVN